MTPTYRRLVQASAWYDLIVTAAFATPWTFMWLHASLRRLAAGLPGSFPDFMPVHVLMANLLGSIVVVWSVLRLIEPRVLYGRADAVARFLFAAWQIVAVSRGATTLIYAFAVPELIFGVLQALPLAWFAAERGAASDRPLAT